MPIKSNLEKYEKKIKEKQIKLDKLEVELFNRKKNQNLEKSYWTKKIRWILNFENEMLYLIDLDEVINEFAIVIFH